MATAAKQPEPEANKSNPSGFIEGVTEGAVAIEYYPEREGQASVGDAKAVRLFHLSVPKKTKIEGTNQILTSIETITLKPGTNWVDPTQWNIGVTHHSNNKALQQRFSVGAIAIRKPSSTTGGKLQGTLEDYSEGDAIELINGIWDVNQLETLQGLEQRRAVRNAIARRIESLQKGEAV